MAATSRIIDYLGEGTAAARPVSLSLSPGSIGIYFAKDTGDVSLWDNDNAVWIALFNATGVGTVTELVAGTGLSGGTIHTTGTIALDTIASHDLLANATGGAAVPSATSLTDLIDAALGSTQGDILYRDAATWQVLAPGTAGQRLTTGGPAANPSWAAGSGGSVTQVDTGTGLTGGPVTTTGTLSFAAIANHELLANISGGSAAPSANTVTAVLDDTMGSAQGDILYRNATTWTVLAPGTSGQVLSTGGTAGNPSWIAAGGTGTVTQIVAGAGLSGGTITSSGTISLTSPVTLVLGGTGTNLSATGGTHQLVQQTGSGSVFTVGTIDSTFLSDVANIAFLNVNQSFTKGQAVTPGTITSGATITPDASLACDFTGTVTQSFTLANPTNLKAGQTLNFWITQDGTGGRTITLDTQYQAAGGASSIVLSTAAGAKDLLTCRADTTTTLTCALIKAISH